MKWADSIVSTAVIAQIDQNRVRSMVKTNQNGVRSMVETSLGRPLHQLMLPGGSRAETGHFRITFWGTLWSPFSILFHHLFERCFRNFPEAIQDAVSRQKWCPKWSKRSPKWNKKGSNMDCRTYVKIMVFTVREAHRTFFGNRSQRIFSLSTSKETQRRGLKAHFSDSKVALGSLFGPFLRPGSLLKSDCFFDSFFGWHLTS